MKHVITPRNGYKFEVVVRKPKKAFSHFGYAIDEGDLEKILGNLPKNDSKGILLPMKCWPFTNKQRWESKQCFSDRLTEEEIERMKYDFPLRKKTEE